MTAERDDMGVVHQSVADGIRDCRITEGLMPSFFRELRGDDGRASIIAVFEYLEEVVPLGVLDGREKEVVEHKHVDLGKARERRSVRARCSRDSQLFCEPRDASEKSAQSATAGGFRERRGKVAFPDPGWTEQDYVAYSAAFDQPFRAHPIRIPA